MGEAVNDVTGRGISDWVIKSCMNLFVTFMVELTKKSIKLCKEVGEIEEAARCLVVIDRDNSGFSDAAQEGLYSRIWMSALMSPGSSDRKR
jgi:hypothetical protein